MSPVMLTPPVFVLLPPFAPMMPLALAVAIWLVVVLARPVASFDPASETVKPSLLPIEPPVAFIASVTALTPGAKIIVPDGFVNKLAGAGLLPCPATP